MRHLPPCCQLMPAHKKADFCMCRAQHRVCKHQRGLHLGHPEVQPRPLHAAKYPDALRQVQAWLYICTSHLEPESGIPMSCLVPDQYHWSHLGTSMAVALHHTLT